MPQTLGMISVRAPAQALDELITAFRVDCIATVGVPRTPLSQQAARRTRSLALPLGPTCFEDLPQAGAGQHHLVVFSAHEGSLPQTEGATRWEVLTGGLVALSRRRAQDVVFVVDRIGRFTVADSNDPADASEVGFPSADLVARAAACLLPNYVVSVNGDRLILYPKGAVEANELVQIMTTSRLAPEGEAPQVAVASAERRMGELSPQEVASIQDLAATHVYLSASHAIRSGGIYLLWAALALAGQGQLGLAKQRLEAAALFGCSRSRIAVHRSVFVTSEGVQDEAREEA